MIRTDPTTQPVLSQIFDQNGTQTESKPVSSLEEFEEKYSIKMDDGIISIAERTTKLVLAKFTSRKGEDQCIDYGNPSHFHNGIFYFVLSSERYTAKYVYSFDLAKKSIKCILAPLHNPHFFKSRLIEFGSNFTVPGPQHYRHNSTGIVTVYDLSAPQGQKEVKKIFVEDGSCGGWDGSIDEENEEIHAFDHVTGKTKNYPIFDKV